MMRAELVDAVALSIAIAQDADYWAEDIANWEGSEAWEREAHPDNFPWFAYEDREWYRKSAIAALSAVAADSLRGEETPLCKTCGGAGEVPAAWADDGVMDNCPARCGSRPMSGSTDESPTLNISALEFQSDAPIDISTGEDQL